MDAEFGVEKAKELIKFGDRSDGGFSAAAGGALFDGDGGREAGNGVHIWLFQLFDELASVGIETVKVPALAFAKKKIEGEGAFARSGESRDNDHLISGNAEIEVLKIVVTGTPNDHLVGERLFS